MSFTDPALLQSLLLMLGLIWGIVLTVAMVAVIFLRLAMRPLIGAQNENVRKQALRWRGRVSGVIILLAILTAAGVSGWATWITGHGEDAWLATKNLLAEIPRQRWLALAAGSGRVVLAGFGAFIGARLCASLLAAVHRSARSWSHLRAEPASLESFFATLTRLSRHVLWLLVAVYASEQLFLPDAAAGALRTAIIIYLIVSIGWLLARATAAIVDTLDALSRTYLERTSWLRWYDAVRPLVPLLRLCVEYALWVGTATLALMQIEAMATFATYGPRLIEAIGIFFLARVAIELGHLLISNRLLRDDLEATRRRRNATFAPLLKSLYKGAVFFVAGVLVLNALGLDATPFLAGAGILGMVIGLGAQPMINDLVSGFFIIFENQFLVGDLIEIDGARGTVEAIDFRTTRLRDIEGRVHLIRNGDCRRVINYSKDFTNAVVRVDVPAEADLTKVQTALERADARLRDTHGAEILAATEIVLVEALADGHCTTRTIVRTAPGRHWALGAELRKLIREELHAAGIRLSLPRREMITVSAQN